MYLKPVYFTKSGDFFKLNLSKMFFFELLFIVVYHCARNVCVSLTLKSLKENAILDSLPLDINFDKSFEKSDSRENVSQSTPTLFSRTLKVRLFLISS
jgi:hypothetical protein